MQRSIALAVGLVFIWVGERVVDAPTARALCSGLGLALVLGAVVARLLAFSRSTGVARRIHGAFLALASLATVSLGLYAAQSDLWTRAAGAALATSSPQLAGILGALWPTLLTIALLPTLLMELAFASMAKAPTLEAGRVREAMYSGLALAFVLVFAFSAQYVATERDAKADLSYFRVAKASEATKKLVASVDEPLEVYLFFPPGSGSAEAVRGFFDELKAASPLVTVTTLDHALEPARAKELGVSGNGTVVLKKGGRKETFYIAVEADKARTQLRNLDAEVQKRLYQVARGRRTVYLTAGHGERTRDSLGGADQRATIDLLYKTLQDLNFDVRPLSAAEGLGQEVPSDAAAVFVVGPTSAFSQPEAEALAAWEKRGGRVFIALDPEAGLTFDELLKPLGLSFSPHNLAQERGIVTVRPPPSRADRANIGTRTYSSHPAVTNLGRTNAPVVFLRAGALDELGQHPADLAIDFAVRSIPDAWTDVDGNFEYDAAGGEVQKAWGLVAAVSRRGAGTKDDALRALVLGDSDAVADEALPAVLGNQYLLVDGLKWLLGEEQLQGASSSEQDIALRYDKQGDSLWFYGTTFLAPLLVLGVGLWVRRRSRRTTKGVEA